MSNTQAKRYRLKKDIDCPELKAKQGTIGELNEQTGKVWFGEEKNFFYNLATVLSATDWFEEIVEPEQGNGFVWTDELVKELAHQHNLSGMPCYPEDIERFKQSKSSSPAQENEYPISEYASDLVKGAKKVEAKDWEIVQYLEDGLLFTRSCSIDGEYYSVNHLLYKGDKGKNIYSVRREDGEIFTLGDEMDNGTTIRYFGITNGHMHIDAKRDSPLTFYSVPIRIAQKKLPSPSTQPSQGYNQDNVAKSVLSKTDSWEENTEQKAAASERIEVSVDATLENNGTKLKVFIKEKSLSSGEAFEIQQAIIAMVNGMEFHSVPNFIFSHNKGYTLQQLEDAFNAARFVTLGVPHNNPRFSDFQDYIQSLKK